MKSSGKKTPISEKFITDSRSVIRTLRNTNQLIEGCWYVINNNSLLNGGDIWLLATGTGTLSCHCFFDQSYDSTQSWSGEYDIDSNRFEYLRDKNNNEVWTWAAINRFDWGNNAFRENKVSGTWLTTPGSTVTFAENVIEQDSYVDMRNISGTILNNTWTSNARTYHIGSSNLFMRGNDFSSYAYLTTANMPNVRIEYSTIQNYGYVRIFGAVTSATISYTNLSTRAYLQINGGASRVNSTNIESYSYVYLINSNAAVYYSNVSSRGYLLLNGGAPRIYYTNLDSFGYLYLLNSDSWVYRSAFSNRSYYYLRNGASRHYDINSMSYGYALIQNNTATSRIDRLTLDSYGRFYQNNGGGTTNNVRISTAAQLRLNNHNGTASILTYDTRFIMNGGKNAGFSLTRCYGKGTITQTQPAGQTDINKGRDYFNNNY